MRKIDWKKKNRQWSHITDRKGYTLVELIVTFALLAIFMTAVVACLPNITKIYMNLQAINHQKTICNTVSNQIRNELQTILGVDNVDDALGVKNEKENGYIVLLDGSGQQVMISTGAALSTVEGETIQFVVPRTGPYVAQMDTKGFNGYTLYNNKKKLMVDYHDTNAISSGALLTRYYEVEDSEVSTDSSIKLVTNITYDSTKYSVTSEAGIVSEGDDLNVAYALNYPYAKPFYEGYELKTKFIIKKEAFYTYGNGTSESPERTYVNYINYTLSLWKDGHMTYSQDYVVKLQNAVPYLGTEVAIDPVVPDEPEEFTDKDTYIEIGSLYPDQIDGDGLTRQGMYHFTIHIASSVSQTNRNDHWLVKMPKGIQLIETTSGNGTDCIKWKANSEKNAVEIYLAEDENDGIGVGHLPKIERTIGIKVVSDDGKLFDDRMDALDGTKMLEMWQEWPRTSLNNTSITVECNNQWGGTRLAITSTQQTVKEYLEFTYDAEVESVDENQLQDCYYIIDDKKLYVYGRSIKKGYTDKLSIIPSFKDHQYHAPVKVMVDDTELPID